MKNTPKWRQWLIQDGASVARELRAGLTTFLTMAYILFANPDILGAAIPVDRSQLLTVTALCAAFGSIMMGLLARYPFALAPGMGLNALFAFTLCGANGMSWQAASACVVVAGLLFLLLSVSGIRKLIVESFPPSLKEAMAAGIGLFLAFIGLANAGLVVNEEHTLVTLGSLKSPSALICLISLITASILIMRGWSSGILVGIAVGTASAIFSGASVYQGQPFAGFQHGFAGLPVLPVDLVFQFDFSAIMSTAMLGPIFMVLFVDFFDTAGTLYGLASRSNFLDRNHQLPRANQAFLADAIATLFSGIVGCSPTTTYIESAAGVETGGRTGLTAVVVGLLFLLSLFFWPLMTAVPGAATASALIIVGAMMMRNVSKIAWHDPMQGIPAFLTIVLMPLTYSISNGIAIGIIAYGVMSIAALKFTRMHVTMQILAALMILRYWLW